MINTAALENKLSALNIPGKVVKIDSNIFYNDIYISFPDYITFNKIKARKTDIEIFLNTAIEITYNNGCIVIRSSQKNHNVIKTFDYMSGIKSGDHILPLAIGQNENSEKVYIDLTKAPHLLAGGATGSGKSVFLNNCIISLLYGAKSALCLIDVKRVEFSIYDGISNLAAPIAYTTRDAKKLLKNAVYEMEKRYDKLQKSGCRSIQEYNQKHNDMQYVTIIIDELADLLLQDKSIETLIVRIAQLGRAAGMHLILATQRPDATIISGLIRANIPSRICFAVQKATDSRIILDETGGEKLTGAGDGILKLAGSNSQRIQAPYISTEDVQKVVDYLKSL